MIPNYCDPKCNVQHCASPFLQLQAWATGQTENMRCVVWSIHTKNQLVSWWQPMMSLLAFFIWSLRPEHGTMPRGRQCLVPHLGNHGYISTLRRSLPRPSIGGGWEIPPFYVKCFEYPEKRYINVRNDYYYYYYSVFVCIRAPVLLGLCFLLSAGLLTVPLLLLARTSLLDI